MELKIKRGDGNTLLRAALLMTGGTGQLPTRRAALGPRPPVRPREPR